MIASSAPENTLLNPRDTTVPWLMPVWAASTPGSALTWSATVVAVLRATSSAETVETDAGASSAFSWRREAVTTTGFRVSARERSEMLTSVSAPALTTTPSTRVVA